MQIGIATPEFDDWSGLRRLLQDAFACMDGRIDPPSSLHRMSGDDLRAKAGKESLIVASENGAIVGCAFAEVGEGRVYVGKLAVARQARGRGIARQMMAVAERIARHRGLAFLELQTRIELVENHEVFARLGFQKVAETAHPGYQRPTSITMRKRVAPEAERDG